MTNTRIDPTPDNREKIDKDTLRLVQTLPKKHGNGNEFVGYLRISDENFNDDSRYPPVVGESGAEQTIEVMDMKELDSLPPALNRKGTFRKNHSFVEGVQPTMDSFYFWLNGDSLWYSEKIDSTIILGQMKITGITPGLMPAHTCFQVVNKEDNIRVKPTAWLLCSPDGTIPNDWTCPIQKTLDQECETFDAAVELPVTTVLEPQIILPLPAPDCKTDFNYNFHGKNWVCNCNVGLQQSPIDLPGSNNSKPLSNNASFKYETIDKSKLEMVYDINILKLRFKDRKGNFGVLIDTDQTNYEAYEIHFHTPGEHSQNQAAKEMEVQILHRPVSGNFGQQAVLAIMYDRLAGEVPNVFGKFDLMNFPNPSANVNEDSLTQDINVLNFIFEDEDTIKANSNFNYFKYMGSMTSPPCAEQVVWFIAQDVKKVGPTVLAMLRDVLKTPGQTGVQEDNYDGNNRAVQPLNSREVFFFDKNLSCFGDKASVPLPETVIESHYEKVTQPVSQYFHFDNLDASGMEGAVVVSKVEAESLDDVKRKPNTRFDNGIV